MALGLDIGHDKRNTSIYPLGIVVGAATIAVWLKI
jgi:hypothetical protein